MSGEAAGTLLSVNVGMPKDVRWHDRAVHTGIFKDPVAGPRMVRRLNVDGDGQGDLGGHGGEQRAVLVYQDESYRHWREHLGRPDLSPGMFGENFTVSGLGDGEVCVGDRYRIGEAEFEVTQPRVTCFRVGMRLGMPEMPALLVDHGRPGFYLRVICEGEVRAGDAIVRTRVGPEELTVAEIDALLYLPGRDRARLERAVKIPALSPGWQQSFRDLLAADPSDASAAGPVVGTEPGWDGFRRLTVAKVVAETDEVTSYYLSAGGVELPAAVPGQYLTLRLADGGGGALVRSYSISGTPDRSTYRISVKREDGGVASRRLHDGVGPGDVLEVAAPRGDFGLDDGDAPVVFLSAGIGVTPVLSMLAGLAAASSTRPVRWLHTARGPARHAFAAEAAALLGRLPDASGRVFYTRATPEESAAAGAVPGRLDEAALAELPADAVVYVCGPAPFIEAMTAALLRRGFPQGRVRSEVFGTLAAINPGIAGAVVRAPHQPAGETGTGPAVTFARSGLTTRWRDGDPSLLELAEAADVPTRWSCRTGVCHTCITGLLAGAVEYDPAPLERPAGSSVLVCCARPATDLVLDL